MEIKDNLILNGLSDYIRIYDNIFPEKVLKNFYRICKEHGEFGDATIVGNPKEELLDKEIRDTKSWSLNNVGQKSKTTIHWANLLMCFFNHNIKKYESSVSKENIGCTINSMQVLKYEKNGHYKIHSDHCHKIPRTLSCIFFINDDYDGGELIFKTPDQEKKIQIDKKTNRLIIWPSNFLYPHAVMPVTEGVRYSVVAWAI
tara:strand:+ start:1817 stop:2419 length:603 start_codon:yes stop_codon:yes gene_type:complete